MQVRRLWEKASFKGPDVWLYILTSHSTFEQGRCKITLPLAAASGLGESIKLVTALKATQ